MKKRNERDSFFSLWKREKYQQIIIGQELLRAIFEKKPKDTYKYWKEILMVKSRV
jgi:hypothetical protein